MKRRISIITLIVGVLILLLVVLFDPFSSSFPISPLAHIYQKPLNKYTFSALKKRSYFGGTISIGKTRSNNNGFTSYMMYFNSDGKRVSGFINIPALSSGRTPQSGVPTLSGAPIIVLLRGYVDRAQYKTGIGSQPVGDFLAQNGYITISPDFLGYGESDKPSLDPLEERFQTYTTVLNLFASLKNLNETLRAQKILIQADTNRVGIWAHSNGGHIALATLAISGKTYPTVLWAPVSKPFPYSILYFTDDSDDHGKALRKVVAQFEDDYDAELYSPPRYFSWITAPIQLHQGTADEAVPLRWSDDLYKTMTTLKKKITYLTYPGADHNLLPNAWSNAATSSFSFYQIYFAQ